MTGLINGIPFIIPFLIYQIITSGLEEPGWRGYLLPKFQKSGYTAEKSSFYIGVLWSLWHWPFLIFYFSTNSEMIPPDIPQDILVPVMLFVIGQSLFLHLISMIGMAFIYTWIYNNTESVFLCIIFHALTNVVGAYAALLITSPIASMALGVMPWVIVFFLMRRYDAETFTRPKLT